MPSRFKKVDGIDYKKGAIDYPSKLAPSDYYHLYTKPFYNLKNKVSRWQGRGIDEDTLRHFIDFANIAYQLALPPGSRILDVGCGSGWLSEYFARFGYRMTGIDVSPSLIDIARERIQSVPYGVDEQTSLDCRFMVHDIELGPLNDLFDAIICYDSLHHFEDEHAVLKHLNQMLPDGGVLFVAEGEKPPAGSASENELSAVMKEFETLEAPFARDYLVEILLKNGFVVTGDYTAVSGFVERENFAGSSLTFVETPSFNYLLCKKTEQRDLADSRSPRQLQARILLLGEGVTTTAAGSSFDLDLEIKNTGDTLWLVSRQPLRGRVRLGLKILNEAGEVAEEVHGSPPLERPLAPGEKTLVRLTVTAPQRPGRYRLKLDLLSQDVCWFEQHGSQVFTMEFEAR